MRLIFSLIFLAGMGAQPAPAQDTALSRAMLHVRADEWAAAFGAARAGGQIVGDIVEWRRLRAGEGRFEDYRAFLKANSDWPGLDLVRRQGEEAITRSTPATQILAFFDGRTPETANGALQLARALYATGQDPQAAQTLAGAWTTLSILPDAREVFLNDHVSVIADFHTQRLDMLLWRGLSGEARAMLPLVSDDWRKLAEARIALRENKRGVDDLIAAVPQALKDDPGLAYERFLWRIERGRTDDAVELALERSASAESLGLPERWANWRRILARQLMRDGDARRAYALASSHHLESGSDYADLEWLSGYLSLRKLNDAETALKHFQNFRIAVSTPISLGRAGYWEGRAQDALGNTEAAQAAFAFGGEYQTSFYGLLSAERAGLPMDPAFVTSEEFPDWRAASFNDSPVVIAARLLLAAGELNLAEWFLLHAAERMNRTELGQLVDMALELDEPHLALRIAKQVASNGDVLIHGYFPLHPLSREDLTVPAELALSIARRESEFDPGVVSPAGARGLMQLMPGTAREVSNLLEVSYRPGDLLADWRYNAKLGSSYLDSLTQRFGPSYVLVSVAYNAGPSRAERWIEQFGDPRDPSVDPVDWIEHIPFRETRNYVMRVMESLPIYRARLTGELTPLRLSEELRISTAPTD